MNDEVVKAEIVNEEIKRKIAELENEFNLEENNFTQQKP